MASPSLRGFKLPFCRRCPAEQEPPDPAHHTQSPERLRRSGEAVCSPFDLHPADAMNFTQRSSPPEAGRPYIYLSLCRAASVAGVVTAPHFPTGTTPIAGQRGFERPPAPLILPEEMQHLKYCLLATLALLAGSAAG